MPDRDLPDRDLPDRDLPDRDLPDAQSDSSEAPFRSAEAWLADRGVERQSIEIPPVEDATPAAETPAPPAAADAAAPGPGGPPMSAREAQRMAEASARDAHLMPDDLPTDGSAPEGGADDLAPDLSDEVARAVSFIRRSTSAAPKSQQRMRERLEQREHPRVVIDLAIRRACEERLLDDRVMAAALVEECRRKGHAPLRLRTDLAKRGFPRPLIDELLAPDEGEDPQARVFGIARTKATSLASLEPDTAYRRLVGYLARRGYTESISRKAARDAIYSDREARRAAEH